MVIRESYLKRIRPFIGKDIIKVLTGIRGAGKSVLLKQIRDEINSPNTIYLNFEAVTNWHLCEYQALQDYVSEKIGDSKEQFYLFLDEIQEVGGWEMAVNSLRARFHADIYITASNSQLLSGELVTRYISGRYVSFVVYPFSYAEFRKVNAGLTFEDYLRCGGMPFLSNLVGCGTKLCSSYLQDAFSSVVLKDVVKRSSIRDVDLLERIISYVFANVGRSFSATSISKFFKSEGRGAAPETVLNYLNACEEAHLFCRFKSLDISGKKVLKANEKYYAADHGLRGAIIGGNLKNVELILDLENIVAIELLRRGFAVRAGCAGEKEIDFVAEKRGEKLYVQVCFLLNDESAVQREFGPLLDVRDNYPKVVLYKDGSFQGNYEGIPAIRIEDWLLEV